MTNQTLDKIAPALVAAIAEMPALEMDGRNPYFKSKYTTLGAVIAATRDILARHKLAVSQQVVSDPTGDAIGIRTVLIHESGQVMSWEAVVKIPSGGNPGQEAGKLITYLRRYSLAAALNLYSDEDIDANNKNQILDKLGYKPEVKQTGKASQSSQYNKPDNIASMTIQQARKVTDSKGKPYIELDNTTLSYKSGSISKAINNNGNDPERKAELERKLQAIKTILKERNQGGITEP